MGRINKNDNTPSEVESTILAECQCDRCGKKELEDCYEIPQGWFYLSYRASKIYDGFNVGMYCCKECLLAAITDNDIPPGFVAVIGKRWHEKN
jgi:hypothetical protein